MDTGVAGAAVDLGRYGRRIVKMIWDPEPTNDVDANLPVWCLGCSYRLEPNANTEKTTTKPAAVEPHDAAAEPIFPTAASTSSTNAPPVPTPPPEAAKAVTKPPSNAPDTPPESVASSFDSSLAYEDAPRDDGWPPAFLDDFESRFWMTYRSGFQPIPRSTDPRAVSSLSFAMRIKTLGDQTGGFASDSGWGCMIRSGQSMLANALII
ncbi:MAG: cysteine protease ATG4, partial [Thaumarchaeota archaeon]|nr:cysteine protease ATG4 [Nitrososphaerota archaeon]